ncbi:unnamed protein product [Didymodactylos carnosus]|uniref:CCHC-type domain-containing protein n=1 Tax=Didymodactylos carnosus TaxID=1234261 RepID=A0A8S2FF81_9BILA|nr:unnamed protein product [Didymodactylos carnosus]CAF4245799.1 unnamed protein product [Didymodactylos carnosus]
MASTTFDINIELVAVRQKIEATERGIVATEQKIEATDIVINEWMKKDEATLQRLVSALSQLQDEKNLLIKQENLFIEQHLKQAAGPFLASVLPETLAPPTVFAVSGPLCASRLSVVSTETKFDRLVKRVQQPNEPNVSYYDDALRLCREVDANMTSMSIVQHLISGVRQDVREQLLRPDSPTDTPENFFKIAKKEEDFKQISQPVGQPRSQSYFSFNDQSTISAVTHKPSLSDKRLSIPPLSSTRERQIQSNQVPHFGANIDRQSQQYPGNQYRTSPNATPFRPCKICQRTHHRTIDWLNKKSQGCFKCGQSNHQVCDCPQSFFG